MTVDGSGSFVVNYGAGSAFDPTQIVLSSFLAVGLPGDYNQNGVVDAAEYVLWRNSFAQTGTGLPADGNGNGTVESGDYLVWRGNFGLSVASATLTEANLSFASAIVPEPWSWLLAFTGSLLIVIQQRAIRAWPAC